MPKISLTSSKYSIINKVKYGYEVTLASTKDFVVKQVFLFAKNCSKYGESSKGSRTFKVISGKLYLTFEVDGKKDCKELRVNESVTFEPKTPFMFSTGSEDCEFTLVESAKYAESFKVIENTEITSFKNNYTFNKDTSDSNKASSSAEQDNRANTEISRKQAEAQAAQRLDKERNAKLNPPVVRSVERSKDSNFITSTINPAPMSENSLLMDD